VKKPNGRILFKSLWSQFNISYVTRHDTFSVFIPALSKVHNAQCDLIIIYTRS